MKTFASLTATDFGIHGEARAYLEAERTRLWDLCELVIAEARREPRSETAIAAWLMEMRQICRAKKRRRG